MDAFAAVIRGTMSSKSKLNTSGWPRCGTWSALRHLNGLSAPCTASTSLL
jgi:hypothetical protein